MRLADAEKVKRKIKYIARTYGTSESTRNKLLNAVDDSIVDAEPVRHGHWFEGGGLLMPMHKYDEHTNPEAVFYTTCSECRVTINCNGVLGGYSYCPHCGAKMDGGSEK